MVFYHIEMYIKHWSQPIHNFTTVIKFIINGIYGNDINEIATLRQKHTSEVSLVGNTLAKHIPDQCYSKYT